MSAPDKPLADSVLTFLDAHIALLGLLDAYQQRQEVPDEDQFRTHLKTLQEHRSDAVIFLVRYSPTPGNYSTAQAECIVEGLCAAWASCLTQPWGYLDLANTRGIVQESGQKFATALYLYEEESEPPDNEPASETADTSQTVVDDPNSFVPVKTLWPLRSEFKRDSDVTKFLDKIPNKPAPDGIRNHRKGQRRFVHAGDWLRHFAEKDRKASEALDAETVQKTLADIEARRAQERVRKQGK